MFSPNIFSILSKLEINAKVSMLIEIEFLFLKLCKNKDECTINIMIGNLMIAEKLKMI